MGTLDFNSPTALTAINGWVHSKTNGRISKLLETIDDEVLFRSTPSTSKEMARCFRPKEYTDRPFPRSRWTGSGRAAALRQEETPQYHETDDYQAVDLLYGNGAFAMTVLLPKPGRDCTGRHPCRFEP